MSLRARILTLALPTLLVVAPAAHGAFPQHAKVERKDGGKVRFVGSAPGKPLTGPGSSAGGAARDFVEAHRGDFGVARGATLAQTRSEAQPKGGRAVRFQQSIGGVEVLGGELVVALDAQNRVLSAMGEAEDSSVGTDPTITAAQAEVEAIKVVAKHQQVHAALLKTSGTELKIFNDALIGGPGQDRPSLVWATTVSDGNAVRRLVLVDAERGFIAASIDRAPEAKNRSVCDGNNTPGAGLPCNLPVLTEGGSTGGHNAEVLDAYNFSGATYDYLQQKFGRDSLDGEGMPLKSTVRYCSTDPSDSCPYENAFWNGSQMTYGQGFAAADDIVAHEFAHGLTEFTSNLLYYFQAGAINESMSDVFGELVDLETPSSGDADGDRWKMGEGLTPNGFRHMADPTIFGDPDSMVSPSVTDYNQSGYYVGTSDSGGVHKNSGVNNKAAYLMVDGGTFRGHEVSAIGADKTARVYYAVQTSFLSSGSDYKDLGLALPQACDNLIGTAGISAADCNEVRDAVLAVAMLTDRPEAPDMQECPVGQEPRYVYFDEIDDSASGWDTPSTDPHWFLDDTYATSSPYSLFGPTWRPAIAPYLNAQYSAAQNSSRTIPANAFLRFSHAYEFDFESSTAYDGGVVEVSTNGGSTWAEAVPVASQGAVYDTVLHSGNALGSRPAFAGISAGYKTTVVPLGALAGQSARFRFRIGTDSSVGFAGWNVDDVGIYTCVVPAPPSVVTGDVSGISAAAATVAGTVDPNGRATTYRVEYGAGGALGQATPAVDAGSGDEPVSVSVPLSGLAAGTAYSYRVVATNEKGTTNGPTRTFTTAAAPAPPGGGGGTITPPPGGTTNPPAVTPVTPLLPASLKGTAKALKKGVKAAKVTCANATGALSCKVTFPGAKRKKKVSATLKRGRTTVAKGSVKKANGKGLVTIKGAKGLAKGAYALSVKVGRKTYKFKVTLG